MTTEDNRLNWDDYFMNLAHAAKVRANCSRDKIGAVLTRGHDIVALGYNGTPAGTKNCFEGGCERCSGDWPSGERYDLCMCVHAEINAILMAARQGLSTLGTTLYTTRAPCLSCLKELIQAGIEKLIHGGEFLGKPVTISATQSGLILESGLEIFELVDTKRVYDYNYGTW